MRQFCTVGRLLRREFCEHLLISRLRLETLLGEPEESQRESNYMCYANFRDKQTCE